MKKCNPEIFFKFYNVPKKCCLPHIKDTVFHIILKSTNFYIKKEKYLSVVYRFPPKYAKTFRINNIDLVLVKYLRLKGRYIKNLNKEILKGEIVDYKVKLLINFIKEKTNFGFFLENFSLKLDIIEVFMILIKLIFKILG